ncbi:hypothetical protein CASFOL_030970 [Castilleja foliolosa]|uniref:Uncharacterized protein n=1 Tax=Castilleja foliolosa TaxID=1961234 RepID=A0ABD3C850_9LAMI
MKISSVVPIIFVIILTVSSAVDAHPVWIPEHRCRQKFHSDKCDSKRCMQKCLEKRQGHGICSGSYCICTYFCYQPPN